MPDETKTTDTTAQVADTKVDTKAADTKTDTKTVDTKAEDTKIDWRALPDDWADRDELSKVASRFNDPATLLRSYANAEKQLSKSVTPLGKNASPEDLAKYRKQMNIPAEAKGYHDAIKIDPPAGVDLENEDAQKILGKFYEFAHSQNMTPTQVKGVIAPFLGLVAEDAAAKVERTKTLVDAADQKLKSEWRHEYEPNTKIGQNFVKMVAKESPEFAYLLENVVADGMPLGDHPVMRRVAATLGRRMGEQQLATLTMSDQDVNTGKKSMETLTTQYHDALNKGDRREADRIAAERSALSKTLYGSARA